MVTPSPIRLIAFRLLASIGLVLLAAPTPAAGQQSRVELLAQVQEVIAGGSVTRLDSAEASLSALRDSITDNQGDARLAPALEALATISQARGDFDDAMTLYRDAADVVFALGDPSLSVYLLGQAGNAARAQGANQVAVQAYELGLARLDDSAVNAAAAEAYVRYGLALVYQDFGDHHTARLHFRRIVELMTSFESQVSTVSILNELASSYALSGVADSAASTYTFALRRAERDGEGDQASFALIGLGEVLLSTGMVDSAAAVLQSAEAYDDQRSSEIVGYRHRLLMDAELARVRPAAALSHARKGLALANPQSQEAAWLQIGLGRGYVAVDSAEQARRAYENALTLGDHLENPEIRFVAHEALAQLYYRMAEPDSVRVAYSRAIAAADELADPQLNWQAYRRIAAFLMDVGEMAAARGYMERSLPVAQSIVEPEPLAMTLMSIAYFHQMEGNDRSALQFYRQTLGALKAESRRYLPGVLGEIASALERIGHPDSAVAYHERGIDAARALNDPATQAELLTSYALTMHALQMPDSAFTLLNSARDVYEDISDPDGASFTALVRADLHNRLGQSSLGRQDSSLAAYTLAVGADNQQQLSPGRIRALWGLGNLLLGRAELDSALALYKTAHEAAVVLGDENLVAWGRYHVGVAYGYLSRADSAAVALRDALGRMRQQQDGLGMSSAHDALGRLYDTLGVADSAASHFRQSIALDRERGDSLNLMISSGNFGWSLAKHGDPDSALVRFREALALARALGARRAEYTALGNIAHVHQRRIATPDLVTAVAYYDSAFSAFEAFRSTGSDETRLHFSGYYDYWVSEVVLAWLGRADEIGQEVGAYASLATADRGRAHALLALMGADKPESGAIPDLVGEGRQLAKAAAKAGTVLYYVWAADTLVAWVIRGDVAPVVTRTPVTRPQLEEAVRTYRTALEVGSRPLSERLGTRGNDVLPVSEAARDDPVTTVALVEAERTLSALLFPLAVRQAIQDESSLVIAPAASLNLVPFAALEPQSGHPLGAEKALSYAPSLSLLAALPEPAASISGGFVVGDPAMPLGLAPLPAAAIEGDEVARLLSTERFGGRSATETLARTRMSNASIIHLATHGYAYSEENRRRDSFVVLASDDQNDGLLTVGEILDDPRLELTAELVVLSACQTGLGSLHAAEGTVGLQRAFLGRGARSVLVSLWNVSDEATRALMLAFYDHWLNDDDAPSKAEALRRAQNDVRGMPEYTHPKYWAAFQLVGLN